MTDQTNEYVGTSGLDNLSAVIKYINSFEGKILSINERLKEFLKIQNLVTNLNHTTASYCFAVGCDSNQEKLLDQAFRMESYISQSYFIKNYGFEYSSLINEKFNKTKILIIEYFIENYKKLDRNDIYNSFMMKNSMQGYFEVLEENTNIKIYSDLVFQMFLTCILGELYILTEHYDDAAGSLMNASFIFGVLQERYSPIPQEKIDAFVDEKISMENSKKAKVKWKPHNEKTEKLKEKYLRIMREGKHTSIASAAGYIFANDNVENKKYRWIYDKLSEAIKEE